MLSRGVCTTIPSKPRDSSLYKTVVGITSAVLGYVLYCSRLLLGACTCISTGRKYAPISEVRLISNDSSRNGMRFNLNYSFFPSVGSKMTEFLEEGFNA